MEVVKKTQQRKQMCSGQIGGAGTTMSVVEQPLVAVRDLQMAKGTSSCSALAMRRGEARCCKLKINKRNRTQQTDAVNYTRFLASHLIA